MGRSLTILILDSNPADAHRCVDLLRDQNGIEADFQRVENEQEYRCALSEKDWSLVLSDYAISGFSAIEALRLLQEAKLDVPFIIVTSTIDEETAVNCIKAGASDYILKEQLRRLAPAVKHALAALEDRRARQRLEDQLRHAQNLEMMGMLSAGVAHDFNNFLAAISGSIEVIAPHVADEERPQRALRTIEKAIHQASDITHALLTFGHRVPAHKHRIDLREVVDESTGLLRHLLPDNINIDVQTEKRNTFWVFADENQLQQVLMNLAINAKDAMPEGGTLTFTLASRAMNDAASACYQESNHENAIVRLTVSDTGEGMSEEVKSRALEPFFTTKKRHRGTGLGLAIVHGILENHNASLRIESALGEGSQFFIDIPMSVDS